jgi:hypothetical protein
MFLRIADNEKVELNEPARETLRWEWQEQLASLRDLRRVLATPGTQGTPRVLQFCAYTPRRSAA